MAIEKSVFNNIEEIYDFLFKHYEIEAVDIEILSSGSANCYKVVCKNNVYFLKELQEKFTEEILNLEVRICQHLNSDNVPTSVFIENRYGVYVISERGRFFHLQKFIMGYSLLRNTFDIKLLAEEASYLGKINKSLNTFADLPIGFPKSWFYQWSPKDTISKYSKILSAVDALDNMEISNCITKACQDKIQSIQTISFDYLSFSNLLSLNSHGDYNNCQILCDDKFSDIIAVIDFSSASSVPAVWELIRSYTYSAKECKNGDSLDYHCFKKYIDIYLKERELPLFDIVNMPAFYYYNLLRSTYGFPQYISSHKESLLEFALWRSSLCNWLKNYHTDLSEFLLQQYKGILQ